MSGSISLRICARHVLVRAAPFVPCGRDLVRRQRARTRGERARQDDALFSIPGRILLENLGVLRAILRLQLRALVRLRVNPPQRLEVAQVVVLRKRRR